MILAAAAIPAFGLFLVLAFVWGRTYAGKPYDVYDYGKQCHCGRMMWPPGEGMAPICWPCNQRQLPPPTGAPVRAVEVSR